MDEKVMILLEKIIENQTWMDNRFDSLEGRFDNLESRFDSLENQFSNLQSQFVNMQNRFDSSENQFDDLQNEQTEMQNQLKELTARFIRLETKVENDISNKINALFDAREIQNKKNDIMIRALERIETKIELLQMETAHVRKIK